MAKKSEILIMLASKLGLRDEEKVLSKASEYERLLQMKLTANSNITDIGKVVICLDLAATLYRAEFDVKTAIRHSGLKSQYANSKKLVENLLELNSERLTTKLLCLSLSCGVEESADRVLEEYQKSSKMKVDLNLPQYVCMAVYQACRLNKIKVPKSKLIEKAHLKPAQWAKLDAEWTKFVDEKFEVFKKQKGRTAKNAAIEENEEKMEIDCPSDKEESAETQTETYEEWKTRILDTAYNAINKERDIKKQTLNKEDKNIKLKISPQKHVNHDKQRVTELITEDGTKRSPKTFNNALQTKKQSLNIEHETKKLKISPRKYDSHNKRRVTEQVTENKTSQSPKQSLKLKLKPIKKSDSESEKINKLLVSNRQSPTKPLLVLNNIDSEGLRRSPRKFHVQNRQSPGKPLLVLNEIDCEGLRRSPRKMPQKYDPYTSPTKTKGVRLLFPL